MSASKKPSPLRDSVHAFIAANPGCTMREICAGVGRKDNGGVRIALLALTDVEEYGDKPRRYRIAQEAIVG